MQDIDLAQLVKTIGSEMRAVGATHCRLESENTKIELVLASDQLFDSQAPPDSPKEIAQGDCKACGARPIGKSSYAKSNELCTDCSRNRMTGQG